MRSALGPRFSEGARLLWGVLEREPGGMAGIAERIGGACRKGTVCHWLYGARVPPVTVIIRMDRLWSIRPQTWVSPPRRPFVPPAARA